MNNIEQVTFVNAKVTEYYGIALQLSEDERSMICVVQIGTGNTVETSKLAEVLFDYSAMKNIIPENQIDDEFYVTNTKDSFFKVKTIEGNNCIYHEFTKIKPSEELL